MTFRNTLGEYLDNGHGCQIQHIPIILRKLRRLAGIIRSLEDYRFYASSLLMIYDGNPSSSKKIDVRIIDFARCVTQEDVRQHHDEFPFPPRHRGPNYGYLLGLKSLAACFEWIYEKHGGDINDLDTKEDCIFDDIGTEESRNVHSSACGRDLSHQQLNSKKKELCSFETYKHSNYFFFANFSKKRKAFLPFNSHYVFFPNSFTITLSLYLYKSYSSFLIPSVLLYPYSL